MVNILFLILLARLGGVLPCGKQNMPPAAFITKDNLWRLKLWNKKEYKQSLDVLVFSYAWLDWFHPDRMGAQLRMLLPFLEAMLPVREGAVLVEALRYAAEHCAFPHGAVRVWIGDGNRITEDEAAWKELEGKFKWW